MSSDLPKDPYKFIPANTAYEGKQRYSCANCHSDTPFRHYYLQCDKICQFKDCITNKSLLHWGNTCPVLANHLKSKRANSALSRQNTSKTFNQLELLRFQDFCDDFTYKLEKSINGIPHRLILHVDDILCLSSNSEITSWFHQTISEYFTITINSSIRSFLGMQVEHDLNNKNNSSTWLCGYPFRQIPHRSFFQISTLSSFFSL